MINQILWEKRNSKHIGGKNITLSITKILINLTNNKNRERAHKREKFAYGNSER